MRRILFLIAVISSVTVHAEDDRKIPMENFIKACPLVYELAKSVMESRQMGMPISEAIKPIGGVDDEDIQEFNKELVINAYKIAVMDKPKEKQSVVESFANQAAISCLESK